MPNTLLKKLTVLSALLAAMSLVTACGNDDEPEQHQKTQTAANGDKFNDADVTFATDMVQHHAQALKMVDMTMGRDLDPQVEQLAEQIRTAQVREVETMVDWLTAWDKPVPATVQDHANAHGDGDMGMDDMETDDMETDEKPGAMTNQEFDDLETTKGDEFQTMWLEMMVRHHEGAIEMAATEEADGEFADAKAMAKSIQASQQEEIDLMQGLLDS
jgi:uncharacterized protein (DUF305 family)